jgi:UDP-GlcNAc:undecaprenyl-phosphate/decaprenyl-phosphate GlcNAc-1-phosphate transferase
MEASPAIGFTILMIPLLDTLRVFAIRIFKRRSPFSPDRNHIHHLLLDRGLSHRTITLLLVAVNVSMVVFVYLARSLGTTILILSVIALFFTFIAIAYYSRPHDSLDWATDLQDKNEKVKESKLVTFIRDSMLEQKN